MTAPRLQAAAPGAPPPWIARTGPQAGAPGERHLLAAIERLARTPQAAGREWTAVVLHVSRLPPPGPRPHHGRIARAVMQEAGQRTEGQVFSLRNGDVVLLARAGLPALAPLSDRLRAMFARKEANAEIVDLNNAAREVMTLSASEVQKRRAQMQTDFADDLPCVSADRVQLQQVILNLLLNAAEAMEGIEDRPRTLLVRTERERDGAVRLEVRDAGTGFDPATVEKLFEAFYTTKANGMGIGLSICRSIIENHKGRLWATSNDGPGATFSFCIPAA